MSFLSKIFGGVKKGLDVAAAAAANPLVTGAVSAFFPVIAPEMILANRVANLVVSAEAKFRDVPGKNGPEKQALVLSGLQDFMDMFNIVAPDGHEVHYDSDALKKLIDAQVAAFNQAKAFKSTISIGPATVAA